jgi:uncharacterized Zn-binding protein involved in type VI secretion
MVTGLVPHVGGPILPPGAPTVLIDFLPAATVTTMATCVGPPDIIVKGSAGVFINFLPAARLGDQTAHGGVIVMGSPTCIIGEVGSSAPGAGGLGGVVAGLAVALTGSPQVAWLSKFGKGLYASAVEPLVQVAQHPVEAAKGLAYAVAHPIATSQAALPAIEGTLKAAGEGDPTALGKTIGTVGSLLVPGAGEAEGTEDIVRLSRFGDNAATGFITKGVSEDAAMTWLYSSADGQRYFDELSSSSLSQENY